MTIGFQTKKYFLIDRQKTEVSPTIQVQVKNVFKTFIVESPNKSKVPTSAVVTNRKYGVTNRKY